MSEEMMIHPSFPNRRPVPVTLTAFYNVHQEKGWRLLDVGVDVAPPKTLDEMYVGEVKEIAKDLGITIGRKSKAQLIKEIESTPSYYA